MLLWVAVSIDAGHAASCGCPYGALRELALLSSDSDSTCSSRWPRSCNERLPISSAPDPQRHQMLICWPGACASGAARWQPDPLEWVRLPTRLSSGIALDIRHVRCCRCHSLASRGRPLQRVLRRAVLPSQRSAIQQWPIIRAREQNTSCQSAASKCAGGRCQDAADCMGRSG